MLVIGYFITGKFVLWTGCGALALAQKTTFLCFTFLVFKSGWHDVM